MINLSQPPAYSAPVVETITQYGVQFPDGTIEWEDIDDRGVHIFVPKWQPSNTTGYWLDPQYDGNTASRYWAKLSDSYRDFMKSRGIDAEIERVKREIIVIVQPPVEASPTQPL